MPEVVTPPPGLADMIAPPPEAAAPPPEVAADSYAAVTTQKLNTTTRPPGRPGRTAYTLPVDLEVSTQGMLQPDSASSDSAFTEVKDAKLGEYMD